MRYLIIIFSVFILIFTSCKSVQNNHTDKLDLSNKGLKESKIDDILAKHTSIKELSLSNNDLKKVPSNVFHLDLLEVLYLNNNKIDSIPSKIVNLKNLKSISLSGNPIRHLPESLYKMSSLRNVMFIGNFSSQEIEKFRSVFCTNVKLVFYTDVPHFNGLKKCTK